jgi:hypothetical protein
MKIWMINEMPIGHILINLILTLCLQKNITKTNSNTIHHSIFKTKRAGMDRGVLAGGRAKPSAFSLQRT